MNHHNIILYDTVYGPDSRFGSPEYISWYPSETYTVPVIKQLFRKINNYVFLLLIAIELSSVQVLRP